MSIEALYEAVEEQNLVRASAIFEEEMKDRVKAIIEARRGAIGLSVLVEGEEFDEDEELDEDEDEDDESDEDEDEDDEDE